MKLSDEYYSLKLKYRKLFQESAQEIEAKLEQGLSVEQLEKSYKQKWQAEFVVVLLLVNFLRKS